MAFKLTKLELERRDRLAADLKTQASKLEDAIRTFNAVMVEAQEPVNMALTAYNELVTETRAFAEDIASAADDAMNDKSEAWQNGEKAQAANDWKDA